MNAAFLSWLTDTVQHEAYVGQDAYGKPTYTSAVARPARVEYHTQTVFVANTGDVISQSIIYFNWNFSLDERDKLTLVDGTSPSIQQIEKLKDFQGNQDHMRVHL